MCILDNISVGKGKQLSVDIGVIQFKVGKWDILLWGLLFGR